jgi:hypothetical protein
MVQFRETKFIKDLVIAADDGYLYFLTEEEWRSEKYRKELKDFKPGIIDMIRHNVLLAAIPEPEDAPEKASLMGPLGFCYVVNLAGLRTSTVFTEKFAATEDVSYSTWLADAGSKNEVP